MFNIWLVDEDQESRMPPSRRFPLPWSIEDNGAAFVVKEPAGKSLAIFIRRKKRAGGRLAAPAMSGTRRDKLSF